MAGDWIKVEHVTPDKPEIIHMADALAIDQDAVLGKLIRLWVWASEQTSDGNAFVTEMKRKGNGIVLKKSFIDRHTRVTGFADAMIKVGWLIENLHGFEFPNFTRHNGDTAKTRALTQKRVKRFRNGNVTEPALPRARARARAREGVNPLPLFDFPPALDLTEFRAAWTEWIAYRKELGKPYRSRGEKAALAALAEMGPQRAVVAIRHSMAQGWQGFFEPAANGNRKQKETKDIFEGVTINENE